MGAGFPSAIGAKLVHPDKKVIAVCGDGGFMMNSQEIETAIRLKLNLTVVILNDNAFGMIKWKQKHMGFENFNLDYHNPNFVKYAESYGAKGYRVTQTEEYTQILKKCLETDGVHIIEVPVDYSENDKVLTKELAHKICIPK
jgi:acetolactate synthase I/II/III large subunit